MSTPDTTAIEGVLFDVGRTLYQGKGRRNIAPDYTRRALQRVGVDRPDLADEAIKDAYLEATTEIRRRHADTYFRKGGPGPTRDVWLEHNSLVARALGVDHPDFPRALEEQWEGWAPVLAPQPDALETLHGLKARGYKLGVLSNTFRDHREVFRRDGLLDLFDAFVLSFEIDLWKPTPDAFTHSCARLGLRPGAVAYVGDKWQVDILPALDLGMLPIFMEAPERVPPVVPDGVVVIHRLSSLLDLLPGA